MLMGTVEFMAPEQIGDEPLDGRADRFSLADMVFQLFTGQRIYNTGSFVALSFKIVNDPPTLPSLVDPRLPAQVDDVLLRALAKFPADRYPTCLDFITALRAALQPGPAWEPHMPTRPANAAATVLESQGTALPSERKVLPVAPSQRRQTEVQQEPAVPSWKLSSNERTERTAARKSALRRIYAGVAWTVLGELVAVGPLISDHADWGEIIFSIVAVLVIAVILFILSLNRWRPR
jgi:serine/threonine protein kinase